jgi:hypothetical protein
VCHPSYNAKKQFYVEGTQRLVSQLSSVLGKLILSSDADKIMYSYVEGGHDSISRDQFEMLQEKSKAGKGRQVAPLSRNLSLTQLFHSRKIDIKK